MASSRPPAPTRTPIYTGRSAAVAGTSESSHPSTFDCHPIGEKGTVIGGPVLYDLEDTPTVMRWYREILPALPEELSGWFGLITIPPAPPFPEELWGRKACAIVWCYTGPHDRADDVLDPDP